MQKNIRIEDYNSNQITRELTENETERIRLSDDDFIEANFYLFDELGDQGILRNEDGELVFVNEEGISEAGRELVKDRTVNIRFLQPGQGWIASGPYTDAEVDAWAAREGPRSVKTMKRVSSLRLRSPSFRRAGSRRVGKPSSPIVSKSPRMSSHAGRP